MKSWCITIRVWNNSRLVTTLTLSIEGHVQKIRNRDFPVVEIHRIVRIDQSPRSNSYIVIEFCGTTLPWLVHSNIERKANRHMHV